MYREPTCKGKVGLPQHANLAILAQVLRPLNALVNRSERGALPGESGVIGAPRSEG